MSMNAAEHNVSVLVPLRLEAVTRLHLGISRIAVDKVEHDEGFSAHTLRMNNNAVSNEIYGAGTGMLSVPNLTKKLGMNAQHLTQLC